MVCSSNRLVMEINQGEDRAFGFTIQTTYCDEETGQLVTDEYDLTGKTIVFEVKKAPYYSIPPIISKEITETSDEYNVGSIYNPTGGQFKIQVVQEETLFPPMDYYAIIRIKDQTQEFAIAGEGNKSGIFRICKQ